MRTQQSDKVHSELPSAQFRAQKRFFRCAQTKIQRTLCGVQLVSRNVRCRIPRMKTTFATTVLFTSMIAMALGQKPTLGTKTQIAPFPKSCERTKELDGPDRLSEIKAISPVERVALIKALSIQLRPG